MPMTRYLLCGINKFMNANGVAWPSEVALSKATGLSLRCIGRHVANAKKTGWLGVRKVKPATPGRAYVHNQYTALFPTKPPVPDAYGLGKPPAPEAHGFDPNHKHISPKPRAPRNETKSTSVQNRKHDVRLNSLYNNEGDNPNNNNCAHNARAAHVVRTDTRAFFTPGKTNPRNAAAEALATFCKNSDVTGASTSNPIIAAWVAIGVTEQQISEAIGVARDRKPEGPIPVGYLAPIVAQFRQPRPEREPTQLAHRVGTFTE